MKRCCQARQDTLHTACSRPTATRMLTQQALAVVCRSLTKTWWLRSLHVLRLQALLPFFSKSFFTVPSWYLFAIGLEPMSLPLSLSLSLSLCPTGRAGRSDVPGHKAKSPIPLSLPTLSRAYKTTALHGAHVRCTLRCLEISPPAADS